MTEFQTIPVSLFVPSVCPSLQSWARPRDLLPKNKICQTSWDATSLSRLQETNFFPSGTVSCLVISLARKSEHASWHVVRRFVERPRRWESEVDLQPVGLKELRPQSDSL